MGSTNTAVLPVPVWRLRENVAAREHGGNRLGLDRSGRVVALIGHGTQQLGLEPEIGK